MKFYKCSICGQIIKKVKDTGLNVTCCGKEMEEIVPKTNEEGLKEKHLPCYTLNKRNVVVKVGLVPHPSIDPHYIEWIMIETTKGHQTRYLNPGDKPMASFNLDDGERLIAIYSYCNLHSLWKIEVNEEE